MTEFLSVAQRVVEGHFTSILVFVFLLLGWLKYGDKAEALLVKLEGWYNWARAEAVERKLYKVAETAYKYVDNAHRLAAKTNTKVDDDLVNKAEAGLKYALKVMKLMGLEADDNTKDVIKGYFGSIHEAENKAKELSGVLPLLTGKTEEKGSSA